VFVSCPFDGKSYNARSSQFGLRTPVGDPGRVQVVMPRHTLPNRRAHEVTDVEHDGHRYRVGVTRFEDGRPAEVCINSAKARSTLDLHVHDLAAMITLLLQNGVDLATIEESLHRNSDASLAYRVVRLIGCAT
jgi:hypothetical protein